MKSGCEARKLEDMVFDVDAWRSEMRASGDGRRIAWGKEQTYMILKRKIRSNCEVSRANF